MMLVKRTRGSCDSGLGRYSGSGMFNAISRKLVSSGFKKAISRSELCYSSQSYRCCGEQSYFNNTMVGKAVVKGAVSAWQIAAESAVNNTIDSTKKWFVGRKRSIQPSLSVAEGIIVTQKRKLDIDSLIDGSGIVLD